jgi:hypothetical protein
MSYSASLRQQALWIREALDPATPILYGFDMGDIDVDELEAAADYIDMLVESLERANAIILASSVLWRQAT